MNISPWISECSMVLPKRLSIQFLKPTIDFMPFKKKMKWDERTGYIITPVTPSAMRNDGAGWLCLELWPCEELWGRDSGSGSESRGEINSWRDDSEAVRAKGCSFRQLDCRQCSDNTIKRSFRLRVQRVKRGESQIVPESDGGNASVSASTKQIKAGYILATNMKLVL